MYIYYACIKTSFLFDLIMLKMLVLIDVVIVFWLVHVWIHFRETQKWFLFVWGSWLEQILTLDLILSWLILLVNGAIFYVCIMLDLLQATLSNLPVSKFWCFLFSLVLFFFTCINMLFLKDLVEFCIKTKFVSHGGVVILDIM